MRDPRARPGPEGQSGRDLFIARAKPPGVDVVGTSCTEILEQVLGRRVLRVQMESAERSPKAPSGAQIVRSGNLGWYVAGLVPPVRKPSERQACKTPEQKKNWWRLWPFNKNRPQPERPPASLSSGPLYDLGEKTERLYAMAFNNSIPLEVRKVALQEMAECFARKMVPKVSDEPNIEYQSRLKLFLTFSLLGDEGRAEEQLSLALKASKAGSPQGNQKTIDALNQFGQHLAEQSQMTEAVVVLRAAIKFGIASAGSGFPDQANLCTNLAITLFRAGRYHEAELVRREELQLRRLETAEQQQASGMLCQEGLADAIAAQGRFQEAACIYGALLQEIQRLMPPDSPAIHRIRQKADRCGPPPLEANLDTVLNGLVQLSKSGGKDAEVAQERLALISRLPQITRASCMLIALISNHRIGNNAQARELALRLNKEFSGWDLPGLLDEALGGAVKELKDVTPILTTLDAMSRLQGATQQEQDAIKSLLKQYSERKETLK